MERSNHHSNDNDEAAIVHSMANLAYESLKEEYNPDWDPFCIYAQRLKSHTHATQKAFRERFSHGYQTILETLGVKHKL